MTVKYVDSSSGKFLDGALTETGAPSAYGIKTIQDLVKSSLGNTNKFNIFFG